MTLTELRYLAALAETRHFGRAAQKCHVSQPTLSMGIKSLEEKLGLKLCERRRRATLLTQAGQAIADKASTVLSQVKGIGDLALASRDEFHAPLRLGVIYTVAPALLPYLVRAATTSGTRLKLHLRENYTDELLVALRAGMLDAIVISTPFDTDGLEAFPLYSEPFVVAMPSAHPWTRLKRIPPAALASENVLLLTAGMLPRSGARCLPGPEAATCRRRRASVPDPRRQFAVNAAAAPGGTATATTNYFFESGIQPSSLAFIPLTGRGAARISCHHFPTTNPCQENLMKLRYAFLAGLLAAASVHAQTGPVKVVNGVLVGAKGMTLYTFDKDAAGKSVCTGTCATNWPPVMAEGTVAGDYTTFARDDGKMQIAYKGKPLYYWVKDTKAGDMTGDNVNNVWHTAKP